MRTLLTTLLVAALATAAGSAHSEDTASSSKRHRYVVITDMTHDDSQSLLRLLLYSNEIDIQAIVVTNQRMDHGPDSPKPWRTTMETLDAYGDAESMLRKHDPAYPSKQQLLAITREHSGAPTISFVANQDRFWDYVGKGNNRDGKPKSTGATTLLKEVFSRPDSRPLHVGLWGGGVAFSQALWEYKNESAPDDFERLLSNLHIFDVAAQDVTNDLFVDMSALNQTFLGYGTSTFDGERMNVRSYACFKNWGIYLNNPLLDVERIRRVGGDYLTGYGSGGEGDTPSFLHLVSDLHGLNDANVMIESSWGGTYIREPRLQGNCFVESDQSAATLKKWLPVALDDFLARAERTHKNPDQVNHSPILVVNGHATQRSFVIREQNSPLLKLSFEGSKDPDNHEIVFDVFEDTWTTRRSGPQIDVSLPDAKSAVVELPANRLNDLHLIVSATDSGTPPLRSYRRIIVKAPELLIGSDVHARGSVIGRGNLFSHDSGFENAFDGNPKTFVDVHQQPELYVGMDLGRIAERDANVRKIRVYPRPGFASRMIGGKFQTSDRADFSDSITLMVIQTAPHEGWNEYQLAPQRCKRYLRYLAPQDSFCNVAELEFWIAVLP